MFVLHVALQGCLRGRAVDYGLTADTGGHIRYLLDLLAASEADPAIARLVVATRAFDGAYGPDYARPRERVSAKTEILRLPTPEPGYLPKEELWHQVPAFTEALIAWIEAQPRPPDFLHAHYADAGAVAAGIRERLGIPFLFTAHSLGRVKRQLCSGATAQDGIEHRIAAEERALSHAALVIASSRDEAEVQYAGYAAYDPGRIRVIAPGSDVSRFAGAARSEAVERAIDRFLREPEKPPLLALARPVSRKNLPMLVQAYGESPALQARANLVIVAGNRSDIRALEPEPAANLQEILLLIDRYDLYGRVALPKRHDPAEVPAIYAYARARRGLFVNPALNEPFGLTLLEAAAAGLPVLATDSGGPNDILERCGNGELVNPQQPLAIAEAALRMLEDPALWDRYAAAGRGAASAYDWRRHAADYHRLLARLRPGGREERSEATSGPAQDPDHLLVCDIDDTLIGSCDGVRAFTDWLRTRPGMAFAVATGRSLHSALSVLEREGVPAPRVVIASVGSEIYHLAEDGVTYRADRAWRARIEAGWEPERIRRLLSGEPRLRPQAPLEQRRYKLSYLCDGGRDLPERLRERLDRAGLACALVQSHGRYLDVLPEGVSKGTAVERVRQALGLDPGRVLVAGDSGNDVEMLRMARQAIIVANYRDDLGSRPELRHGFVARESYARGVIEGVDHFLRPGRPRPAAAPARP